MLYLFSKLFYVIYECAPRLVSVHMYCTYMYTLLDNTTYMYYIECLSPMQKCRFSNLVWKEAYNLVHVNNTYIQIRFRSHLKYIMFLTVIISEALKVSARNIYIIFQFLVVISWVPLMGSDLKNYQFYSILFYSNINCRPSKYIHLH